MSKFKDLETKVAALEEEIKELRAQFLTLSLRTPTVIISELFKPATVPGTVPIPTWPPYTPYIGDPPPGSGTITISCKSTSMSNT